MSEKVLNIIKDKNIIIPLYMLKFRKKMNLEMESFVFLMYLYSFGQKLLFDAKQISEDLDIEITELMQMINSLVERSLLELEVVKNEKGIIEEYIVLDLFFEKINLSLIEESTKEEKATDIFEDIEREFGRTISPIEIEIIRGWLEAKFSEEMIRLALREASFNGVNNLKYIDRILFEWDKLNLNSKEAIENHLTNRQNKKRTSKDKEEVFDYDWLNSDE